MLDASRILSTGEPGDPRAPEQLLLLIYAELRKLAAQLLAQEQPGQTLEATALVHEAYLRLVATNPDVDWNSRGHFFGAAAEAMRRLLVEAARRRATRKRGGGRTRLALDHLPEAAAHAGPDDLLALNEALQDLERHDAQAASLVKLRYFAGLSHQQAAEALGVSRRAADRLWALARAWLYRRLDRD
jgi:RNA polymerase sigma factor (TIGR02999 family)